MTEGVNEGQNANVTVDGEEAILHITDQSVMFEKRGKVSGFLRSAIQLVKPDGDAMVIAYAVGNEVKSIRVEPITAVVSLLVPSSQPSANTVAGQVRTSLTALDEIFEKLYRQTREELEERLVEVQRAPENRNLRLTVDEHKRYSDIWKQMMSMVSAKYGFDPRADDSPLSFWGLEKQPYELQLDVVKIFHIDFLRGLVGPKAETEDIGYSSYEVWPEDWERILVRFKLADRPLLTEKFKSYLKSHWKYHPSDRKPVLALP